MNAQGVQIAGQPKVRVYVSYECAGLMKIQQWFRQAENYGQKKKQWRSFLLLYNGQVRR